MEKISIASLLRAGAHFGHQTKKWNPKMAPYILRKRGDIHIIDLKETLYSMDDAFSFVKNTVARGGVVLFVGTKNQAQDCIVEQATRCGMPYVNNRWLGGMLTNFNTIKNSIRRMEKLEAEKADGTMAKLTKKEQILIMKELVKLQLNLNGVRDLQKAPDAVFVVDSTREEIAVKEAVKLNIPVVSTIDTNADPDNIDYGIAMNDDAIASVQMVVELMAEAVLAGKGQMTHEAQVAEQRRLEAKAAKEAAIASKAAKEAAKKAAAKELVERPATTLKEIMAKDDKPKAEETKNEEKKEA